MATKKPLRQQAPLHSWGIFMEHFQQKTMLGNNMRALEKLAKTWQWAGEWYLQEKLVQQQHVVLVTDNEQRIVFCSGNMIDMTGYQPEEVIGHAPRIFQGIGTSDITRAQIRKAIMAKESFEADILNYKKNGTPYLCHISAHPVFNHKQELVNFIAFENAVV